MSDAASIPPSSVNPEGGAAPQAVASQATVRRARVWFRVLLSLLVLWFGVLATLWYTTVYRPRASQVVPESVPAMTGAPGVTGDAATTTVPASTAPTAR